MLNIQIIFTTVTTTTLVITIILPGGRTKYIEAADPSFYDLQNGLLKL